MEVATAYLPLSLELLQSHKRLCYCLVGDKRLVLFQRALADLGVVGFGDGILEKRFFELIDGDDDAEDFGEGVLKITLGARIGKLYFLYG
jgi:hypothetical protein